jgi:hypothetical protein
MCPVSEGYLRKLPVERTRIFPSPLRLLGKFASLNRYFLQITLTNRIYLFILQFMKGEEWRLFLCFFSSPGHRPCELLSWVSVRPSVSFSHLNLLLWNRWTEISQTCQKCSLDGPLPDLCFWCWFEIQHGCQGP